MKLCLFSPSGGSPRRPTKSTASNSSKNWQKQHKKNKSSANIFENQKRQGWVFTPRTIRAKRWEEEECLPVEIRWANCCGQRAPINFTTDIDILEGQTLQRWEGRGRPKAVRAVRRRGVPRTVPEGWCPEVEGGSPKGGGPEGWGGRNFALSFPPPLCSFFLPLLGVGSWNFGGVIESRDPQMCTSGVLASRTDTPTPQREILHKSWATGGPSQGGPWPKEARHEQQIVPENSPIGQGFQHTSLGKNGFKVVWAKSGAGQMWSGKGEEKSKKKRKKKHPRNKKMKRSLFPTKSTTKSKKC